MKAPRVCRGLYGAFAVGVWAAGDTAGSRRERSGKARAAVRLAARGPEGRLEDVWKVLTLASAARVGCSMSADPRPAASLGADPAVPTRRQARHNWRCPDCGKQPGKFRGFQTSGGMTHPAGTLISGMVDAHLYARIEE